jgi:membrane protein YdbS with pleckstrin-like domain
LISRAFVTSFVGILIPAALATIIAMPFLGPVGLLWLLGGVLAIAMRWLAWRRTRYVLDAGNLFVESGWWRHRRNILPVRKIQSVDLAQNFWSRAFGICTLRLGVAGGSGFSDHHVPGLTRREAEMLRAELLS